MWHNLMINHKQNVFVNEMTELEIGGRETKIWLIVTDAKWEQSRGIGDVRGEGWAAE